MIRFALTPAAALAAALVPVAPLAAAQQEAPPPRIADVPTIKMAPLSSGNFVLVWDHDGATCGSGPVEPTGWIDPQPQFAGKRLLEFPVTVGFSIDETGRAIDIRVIEGGYSVDASDAGVRSVDGAFKLDLDKVLKNNALADLMPSLRASRFAAGAPQTGCRVTYAPRYIAAQEARSDVIAQIGVVPRNRLKPAQLDRIGGADCNTVGWPGPLLRAFPDWRTIEGREGARAWSWTRFDIDAGGVPRNIAVAVSSGHDDLDREVIRITAANRFAEGPRTGCVTSWWRNPEPIQAPPAPDTGSFPDYQDCTAQRSWAKPPKLTFPPAYNDRAIEGWAILAFDVGADGVIADVTVLSAQPTAEFGGAGKAVLQSARLEPAETGQTRCIERVRFVLPNDKTAAPTAD
jgi:hypothetical protein